MAESTYIQGLIQVINTLRREFNRPDWPLNNPDLKKYAAESAISEEDFAALNNVYQAYLDKGKNYFNANNWNDALEEFDMAYQIDPNEEDLLFHLASVYEKRWVNRRTNEDKKKGILYAEKCLEINPKNKQAAIIVTALKQAPVEPWISPKLQKTLISNGRRVIVYGSIIFALYYFRQDIQNYWNSFNTAMTSKFNKKDETKNIFVLQDVLFESGSTTLNVQSKLAVDKLVKYLKDNPKIHGVIGGHTDNVGFADGNLQVSIARAKAVYDYVINHGIDASRINFKGFGDSKPAKPNISEENRAINRRIEFEIVK